jgi:hypothetical protein
VKAIAITIAMAFALLSPRAVHAESEAETRARQILIVLRVLSYDRALATRAPGDKVAIAIVHDGTKAGRADAARWSAGFRLLPNVRVGGRSVTTSEIELVDETVLETAFAQRSPALVVIAGTPDTTAIRRVARRRHVLSFSMREADVRAGVAVGLVVSEDGNEIVINREAARAEGAKLGAGLLQLARLVDGDAP